MFKSIAASLAVALTAANPNEGVPPHTHNCKTSSDSNAPFALGLSRDYEMGGCKCHDDTAKWGPGN